ERGWQPIPVPHAEKSPGNAAGKGWQRLRLTAADLLGYFGDGPMNIGILLGAVSGGLMDVDLDCAEALVLADTFLPATDSVFGRAGKPRSHRLYLVGGDLRTERLRDLDGSTLVELRGAGGQTVFPPSTHPCGEIVAWFSD